MIWLPTLELLLRIAVTSLVLITIAHVIWSIMLVVHYLEHSQLYTKADWRWLRRTVYLIAVLLAAILTQKFFLDNNIPIDMFFLDNPSKQTCYDCKS